MLLRHLAVLGRLAPASPLPTFLKVDRADVFVSFRFPVGGFVGATFGPKGWLPVWWFGRGSCLLSSADRAQVQGDRALFRVPGSGGEAAVS